VHGHGRTYVIKVWAKAHSKHCRKHAYGAPLRHFLATHECKTLDRELATTTVNGHAVGLAQSMASFWGKNVSQAYRATGKFRHLISEDGTGNFYSLFHDGDRLPSGSQTVHSPDAFKALAQDTVVTSVDAWYLHRHTPANAHALIRMIEDSYLQW
jgi:hypothetical protein